MAVYESLAHNADTSTRLGTALALQQPSDTVDCIFPKFLGFPHFRPATGVSIEIPKGRESEAYLVQNMCPYPGYKSTFVSTDHSSLNTCSYTRA